MTHRFLTLATQANALVFLAVCLLSLFDNLRPRWLVAGFVVFLGVSWTLDRLKRKGGRA